MIVAETKIAGAFLITPERLEDERGFFARTFCVKELSEHRIDTRVVQRSVSYNRHRGTLRGMHFQAPPYAENKFISCSRGSVFDVIIDLRRSSPSYRQWLGVTLNGDAFDALFAPAGCAHGFMTLEDDSVVRYDMSEFYVPEASQGLRFDDPAFAIDWPFVPTVVSPRDLTFQPFRDL